MRNVTKTTFFSFSFPIPLSYTSQPSFSIVLCANQKLERKTCNTRATLLWPHLSVTLEMLGNLSFTRRNLINSFVKNLLFFFIEYLFQIYCLSPSEWLSKCSLTWFAAVLDMLSCHVKIWAWRSCFRCQARSGGDQNDCGARNWSTARLIKGERKRFVVFTGMPNLFLEEM